MPGILLAAASGRSSTVPFLCWSYMSLSTAEETARYLALRGGGVEHSVNFWGRMSGTPEVAKTQMVSQSSERVVYAVQRESLVLERGLARQRRCA